MFPLEGEIPGEYKLAAPIQQRTWLVNGELRIWEGECKTVLSPVCVREPDSQTKQLEIGSYPVMGEAQSDEALDAAVSGLRQRARRMADDGGGRSQYDCMQDFLKQMVAQRRTVSQLIMWEIGKSLADSEKEFDRYSRVHQADAYPR